MLSRREAIVAAIIAAITATHPLRAVALPEDPKKIPVNPNPRISSMAQRSQKRERYHSPL